MTDRYRYESSSSLSDLGDRIRSRQTSYSSPSTSSSRYYNPPPTYSPFGSSSRDPRTTRPEISSYFTDDEVVSGNVRVPRRDIGPSSDLGARIRNTVAERQGRGYGAYTPPGYEDVRSRVSGAPSHQDIFDSVRSRVNPDVMTGLGDLIRNRAQGGATSQLGGIPGIAPSQRPEPPNLPNLGNAFDMGQSIRDRVMGGIGGRQQPSIPNDPRISGAPQQSGDGSWGMDQGGYEEGGYTPATDLAPGQGQQQPPMAPTDPGAAPGGSYVPVDPGSAGDWAYGAPTGTVPIGQITGGMDWEQLNQWDPVILQASAAHGVDPARLKAMMIIESGGDPNAQGLGGATGIMQIKPGDWADEAAVHGYDLYTPEGQIMMAAAILGGDTSRTAGLSPDEAFAQAYYPVYDANGNLCLTCPASDNTNHTAQMYLDDMAMYEDIIRGAAPVADQMGGAVDPLTGQPYPIEGGLEGAPVDDGGFTPTQPGFDPVSLVTNGALSAEEIGYGFGAPACPHCQGMYKDYGDWNQDRHPGEDIPMEYGEGYGSPVSGRVTCAGSGVSGVDGGSWGSGCSAFGDDKGGPGRVEVLDEETGISWIMGHSSAVYVQPDEYVTQGQIIGSAGWSEPHVHLEARVYCPEYSSTGWMLVDPADAAKSSDGRADFCNAEYYQSTYYG